MVLDVHDTGTEEDGITRIYKLIKWNGNHKHKHVHAHTLHTAHCTLHIVHCNVYIVRTQSEHKYSYSSFLPPV